MKKMAIKGLVALAAVVALCMFFSGTIKTISTAKVRLVTAKQGKLEEEIKLSGNLTFTQTEEVKLALASDQSVTIKRVRVAKGRKVAAGDVLFEAEVSGYDKEMESLRSDYEAAQKELMELERKNGDVRLKRTEEIWVEAYDALAKSKEDCMTAQTQLEVAAKLAGVTLSGGRLPSGEMIHFRKSFPVFYAEFTSDKHEITPDYLADIESERPSREAQARELWLQTEHLWTQFPGFVEALKKQ